MPYSLKSYTSFDDLMQKRSQAYKNYRWVFILLLVSQYAVGQIDSIKQEKNNYTPSTSLRGAVMGAMVYPGMRMGLERPYTFKEKKIVTPKKTKIVYKTRALSYSLALYHQPNFHTNIFTQAERIVRKVKQKGFYSEFSLGTGLSRTFVDGVSYTVSDNGEIERNRLSGNWYGLVSAGVGLGIDYNLRKSKPYAIYLKHQWCLLFPHHSLIAPRPLLELGVNFNLQMFWPAQPSKSYVEKLRRNKK